MSEMASSYGQHLLLYTYLLTSLYLTIYLYLLTPWSRALLEKLTGFQLVKKFVAFYGTGRFITAFKSAHILYTHVGYIKLKFNRHSVSL